MTCDIQACAHEAKHEDITLMSTVVHPVTGEQQVGSLTVKLCSHHYDVVCGPQASRISMSTIVVDSDLPYNVIPAPWVPGVKS